MVPSDPEEMWGAEDVPGLSGVVWLLWGSLIRVHLHLLLGLAPVLEISQAPVGTGGLQTPQGLLCNLWISVCVHSSWHGQIPTPQLGSASGCAIPKANSRASAV